jgi:hypothetical protein
MAKKQAQFRFEEDFYQDIADLAAASGMTVSEVVRNAIRTYAALFRRTRDGRSRFFIESEEGHSSRCEVILPWLSFR